MKLFTLHIFTTAQAYQLAFLTFDFLLFYTQKLLMFTLQLKHWSVFSLFPAVNMC